jgi:hypothetical protein
VAISRVSKYLLWVLLAAAVIYGGKRLYFSLTGGFLVSNIQIDLPYRSDWEMPPLSLEEQQIVAQALDQTYTYLAKGHQAYAFESADHQYILKFLKFQRITPKPWLLWLPLPAAWEPWREKKVQSKRKVLEQLFSSWKVGMEALRKESGLLFVHLNKTKNLKKILTITDKIGFTHQLNMDELVFAIQRKAVLLPDALAAYIAANDGAGAEQLLDRLLDLYRTECKNGVCERDYETMRNTGVLGGLPVHIDLGRFERDATLRDPIKAREVILWKMTTRFIPWLRKHYPELALYFEQKLNALSEEKPLLSP